MKKTPTLFIPLSSSPLLTIFFFSSDFYPFDYFSGQFHLFHPIVPFLNSLWGNRLLHKPVLTSFSLSIHYSLFPSHPLFLKHFLLKDTLVASTHSLEQFTILWIVTDETFLFCPVLLPAWDFKASSWGKYLLFCVLHHPLFI